jgi:hypothetical protein
MNHKLDRTRMNAIALYLRYYAENFWKRLKKFLQLGNPGFETEIQVTSDFLAQSQFH